MALLGYVCADMSLRYGKLFDATVRTEYELARDIAKQQTAQPPAHTGPVGRTQMPLADICEHCPQLPR